MIDINTLTATSDIMEVRGLNSAYNDRQVLYDIRFRVPRGGITVIMGMSGCGKTTLLRHLIGLKSTSPGQVFLDGRDLGQFSEKDMHEYRRRTGILFQGGALFGSLTVGQNIAVPLRVHTRLSAETIRIMTLMKLHQVGLSDFSEFMPSQLSGGMRKRAGLARALIMDPELLFVDEPSSGLDPITAAGLDVLITRLRDTFGMSIVVVTHELESAFGIADHMIVMDYGRVLVSGSPQDIKNSRDPRVIQFLAREPDAGSYDTRKYIEQLIG